jgi:site-specific recombinase XerD
VHRVTCRAGISKHVSPHTLRHAFITAALDAGVPLRDVQEAASHADPRTTMRYDRARTSPGPARHVHRRRVHRRSSTITVSRQISPAISEGPG